MEKILKYFGYIPEAKVQKTTADLVAKLDYYKGLFSNEFVPKVAFSDYKKDENKSWNENFQEYYELYHRKEYAAYKIRTLSLNPAFLDAFIRTLCRFDFQTVEEYMKKTKWYWKDNKETPNVDELRDCVITLLPNDGEPSEISSGGFTVKFGYEKDRAFCEIKFNKNQ